MTPEQRAAHLRLLATLPLVARHDLREPDPSEMRPITRSGPRFYRRSSRGENRWGYVLGQPMKVIDGKFKGQGPARFDGVHDGERIYLDIGGVRRVTRAKFVRPA